MGGGSRTPSTLPLDSSPNMVVVFPSMHHVPWLTVRLTAQNMAPHALLFIWTYICNLVQTLPFHFVHENPTDPLTGTLAIFSFKSKLLFSLVYSAPSSLFSFQNTRVGIIPSVHPKPQSQTRAKDNILIIKSNSNWGLLTSLNSALPG